MCNERQFCCTKKSVMLLINYVNLFGNKNFNDESYTFENS